MKRVKGFNREAKPSIVEAVYPVVGKAEHAKPDHEECIIKDKTVKEQLFDVIWIHGGASCVKGWDKTSCIDFPAWSEQSPLVLFGLFNTDLAADQIHAVEEIHYHLALALLGHFDKAKTLGNTGLFIGYQGAGLHSAVSFKQSSKLCLCGGAGEIAY